MILKFIGSHLRRKNQSNDHTASIGSILVDMGRITKAQLEDVVSHQSQSNDALLSVELQRRGWVDVGDVIKAMSIQDQLRTGHEAIAKVEITRARLTDAKAASGALRQETARVIPMLRPLAAEAKAG